MNQKTPFTLTQIKEAHGKVQSGADFPNYIKELKQLGVRRYDSYVADGHIDFFGEHNYQATAPAKYDNLQVADESHVEAFKADLKAHQQGKTDYPTFCNDCAKWGVERWTVNINDMTCTYYNKAGNVVLVETIPE